MVVRNLIYRGIEVERERAQQTVHYDLDELAGTWDREDAAEFLEAVEDFAKVDPVLWQ
jgi:hypothetical protein